MRILVVSSYPPRHCGIGAYASGQVARLRAESHEVTVLSPPDGNGDERIEFLDERAILAFEGAGSPGRLVVIASVRSHIPSNVDYERWIASLCDRVPGVELLDRYVPDEEFDAWIAAADAVVLPYRRAWSSGVLARAQTIGTPAIVSDVGGLADQAGPRDTVVHDDGELRKVFEAAPAGRTG